MWFVLLRMPVAHSAGAVFPVVEIDCEEAKGHVTSPLGGEKRTTSRLYRKIYSKIISPKAVKPTTPKGDVTYAQQNAKYQHIAAYFRGHQHGGYHAECGLGSASCGRLCGLFFRPERFDGDGYHDGSMCSHGAFFM